MIAPAIFALGAGGFILALLRPESTRSSLTLLGLVVLLAGLVVWVGLFYSNPRRIEVEQGFVTVLYFGGKKRTCLIHQLIWRRPTRWFDMIMGLECVADTEIGFQFRVWKDLANSKTFLEMLSQKEASKH